MPDSFDLMVWADTSVLPTGDDSVVLSETVKLRPPNWAGEVRVLRDLDQTNPDAALLIFGENPSALARSRFFSLFRRGVPVGALVTGTPVFSEPIFSKLQEWGRCWVFKERGDLVSLVHNSVQEWIGGVTRGLTSYPSGEELIRSWSGVAGESIDSQSLLQASAILRDRGFVCLSGTMGAGKTTLARLLLMESADEGLIPMELIDSYVDAGTVERKLRGPEDCILLFDLDSIRRQISIHPLHLFHSALTIILRATDARRRVVLTSSDPRMAGLFSLFGDAHVILPSPEENRQWRIEQGENALSSFKDLDLFAKAELILLSLFEPIVSESVFKSSLYEIWSRLHFLLRETFPSDTALEEMYEDTKAFKGIAPFRRLFIDGKLHFCSGDTLILNAVDRGMAELSGGGSPLIRIVMETLLNSSNSDQRKAGYNIAHMYRYLSSSEKSRLLFTASRETEPDNVSDFFAMLVSDKEAFDRAAEGLYRHILESGTLELRRTLAQALGNPWLRKDHYFRDLIEAAAGDADDLVRGYLLRSIDMWGIAGDPGGFVERFTGDGSDTVRRFMLFLLGRRFPKISGREMALINDALAAENNSDDLSSLVRGLMNRQLGDFDEESGDLLWLLMQRLPRGGRGIVAFNIGARIRFFDNSIRETLFSDVSGEDLRTVAQCMLINWEDLTPSEKDILWELISKNLHRNKQMAVMVLPYIRILDETEQKKLLHITLASEGYGGREALSQLLAGGREDVAKTTLEVVDELCSGGSMEERSRLPWFLLWNRPSLGDRAEFYLERLSRDPDATVRKSLAMGIRRLGLMGEAELKLLHVLSFDQERSVRGACGEALAEFASDGGLSAGRIAVLAGDSDPFVRSSLLKGAQNAPYPGIEEKTAFYMKLLTDPDASVRLEAVGALSDLAVIPETPGLIEKLTDLLSDRSEDIRNAVASLVTGHPSVTNSRELREKLPDLYLGRLSGGDSLAEELSTARRIQMDLLPREAPRYENYDIAVYYSSAREVGGDYYDFFSLPDGNLGIAIADVAGKGIPASLTMAGMKGSLSASVNSIFDISLIMKRVNSDLTVGTEISSLVGLFYGVLNTQNGILTFCNAGHNPPLLMSRDGSVDELTEGGLLMGVSKDAEYEFGIRRTHPGDVLVLYTDGITETMDENEVEFDVTGLIETVLNHRDLNAEQIVSRVLKAVNAHGNGAAQADDRTLVVIKRR